MLPVHVSGEVFFQLFHVIPDAPTSVILGLDFLHNNHAKLDLSAHTLTLNNGKQFPLEGLPKCTSLLKTCCSVTVPAHSEMIFPVKSKNDQLPGQLLVEPLTSTWQQLGLLVARALIINKPNHRLCRVLNLTDNAITIPPNFAIAKGSFISSANITPLARKIATPCACSLATSPPHTSPDSHTSSAATNHAEDRWQYVRKARDLGFDLSNSALTEEQKLELLELLGRYEDIFATDLSQLGFTDCVSHHIDTGSSRPVAQSCYRHPPHIREEIDRQVSDLLKHDIIYESASSWQSPSLLVAKKHGHDSDKPSYRLVIDYRKVNQLTSGSRFPLRSLNSIIDQVGQKKPKFFSSFDLFSGFFQVPLDPETAHKTAFCTDKGQYTFKRTPFGLKNSPITFMLAMSHIFRDLQHLMCIYVDDFFAFSSDFQSHLADLSQIFDRFRSSGLTLKPEKCTFAASEVQFLGYTFSEKGIVASSHKIKVIKDFPAPKNQKEVKRFLGLTNYFKRHIKNYSILATPLYKLLKRGAKFEWSDQCDSAFKQLRQALIEPPVLAYPRMDLPFIVSCDASSSALGYILSQVQDDTERVIAYSGRSLTPAETKYTVSEKEMLSVVSALKEFNPYLGIQQFKVVTDHSALKYLQNIKPTTSPRLCRWALLASQYNFTIVHRKGSSNAAPDALSRIPYKPEPESTQELMECWPDPSVFEVKGQSESRQHKGKHGKHGNHALVLNENALMKVQNTNHVHALSLPVTTADASLSKPELIPPDIGKLQANCPDLGPLYHYVKDGKIPNDKKVAKRVKFISDQFGMQNNVLYHIYTPRSKQVPVEEKVIHQLVIPESLRVHLMRESHDSAYGGHRGFSRTYLSIRSRYFWHRMYADIYNYCQTCTACQKAKIQKPNKPLPLNPLPIPSSPWSVVHCDIYGPLTVSKEGYRYLLVCVCSFTKFCEAIPLKNVEAPTVARAMYEHVFTRYGMSRVLITDRGSQFTSKLMSALCDLFKIKHLYTSSFRPQTNAQVETYNKTLGNSLRAYCSDANDKWPEVIPGIMMSIRMTPTQACKYSPFYLLYGRHMCTPVDLELTPKPNLPISTQEHLAQIIKNLEVAQKFAAENIKKHQETYTRVHDRKAEDKHFRIGSYVLIRKMAVKPGVCKKLQVKWEGPLYVTDIGPHNTYRLRWCHNNRELKSMINASRMKPFHAPIYTTPFDNAQRLEQAVEREAVDLSDPESADHADDSAVDSTVQPRVVNQTPASSTTQQKDTEAKKPSADYHDVSRIISSAMFRGSRHYKVKLTNAKGTLWLPQSDIAPGLIHIYHMRYTLQGKRKRRKKGNNSVLQKKSQTQTV